MRKIQDDFLLDINNFNEEIKQSEKNYEPFEITFNFKVGRLGNSFLFFDAFLSHYCLLTALKDKFYHLSIDFDERIDVKIPIKKQYYYSERQRDYFYLSGGFFNIPNKVSFLTKRTNEPVIPLVKERRIRTNAGTLKNYKFPVLYDNKKTYIIKGIGNIEMLKKIIPEKGNIGKKTNIGYGQYEMSIKKIDSFNLFDDERKQYIRPVPIEFIKKNNFPLTNKIISVYRPPYYGINASYKECCL